MYSKGTDLTQNDSQLTYFYPKSFSNSMAEKVLNELVSPERECLWLVRNSQSRPGALALNYLIKKGDLTMQGAYLLALEKTNNNDPNEVGKWKILSPDDVNFFPANFQSDLQNLNLYKVKSEKLSDMTARPIDIARTEALITFITTSKDFDFNRAENTSNIKLTKDNMITPSKEINLRAEIESANRYVGKF